jgi:FtsP/CotA-like multicopper oxidase with cupredoxin domain
MEDEMRVSHPHEYFSTDTAALPNASPGELVPLMTGDRFELRIAPVVKRLGDSPVRLLAYNGSVPGPTLRVQQGSEVLVDVVNDGDMEATVHWHGLRLDNRNDGTTDTQAPIRIGDSFTYRLAFPDPGVYWYHPHIREDYGQELGLYGNIIVVPSEPEYWNPVNRELALTLDDILIEDGHVAPFNRAHPTYTAMGRFGNTLLVNGELAPFITARQGEVIRLYLTNTANTRVFNIGLRGARMKLVGGDNGRCERETFVEHVVIAPSERAVVDVLFERAGHVTVEHQTPDALYSLATFDIAANHTGPSYAAQFLNLRVNSEFTDQRARLSGYLEATPAKTLSFVAEMDMGRPEVPPGEAVERTAVGFACPMHPEIRSAQADRCPQCGMKLVPAVLVSEASEHDHAHAHSSEHVRSDLPVGIEWEDDMVDVNKMTNPTNMRWRLIDRETGAEGGAISWTLRVGDLVKIRLVNEMDSDHPMHHPFHIHGAGRFLILSRDGVAEPNLVWKDTVLVPTGQTVDILLDVTHPGLWMAHCHIAEHHESGMMMRFGVDPAIEE